MPPCLCLAFLDSWNAFPLSTHSSENASRTPYLPQPPEYPCSVLLLFPDFKSQLYTLYLYNPEQILNSQSFSFFLYKVVVIIIIALIHSLVLKTEWVTANKALTKCSIHVNCQESIIHFVVNHKLTFSHVSGVELFYIVLFYLTFHIFIQFSCLKEIISQRFLRKSMIWPVKCSEKIKRSDTKTNPLNQQMQTEKYRDTIGFKYFWSWAKYYTLTYQ